MEIKIYLNLISYVMLCGTLLQVLTDGDVNMFI